VWYATPSVADQIVEGRRAIVHWSFEKRQNMDHMEYNDDEMPAAEDRTEAAERLHAPGRQLGNQQMREKASPELEQTSSFNQIKEASRAAE
jgi:hypothetical protein